MDNKVNGIEKKGLVVERWVLPKIKYKGKWYSREALKSSLEKAYRLARKIESKIMATRKPTTHNYKDGCYIGKWAPHQLRVEEQDD